MKKSLEQLLAETDNFELCNEVFIRIDELHGGNPDVSVFSEVERVVILVWHSMGIIGNGAFHYLLEGDFKGDLGFRLTVEAYRAIGCPGAANALQTMLDFFPDSVPFADIDKRLDHYDRCLDSAENPYCHFPDSEEITLCLAHFIRDHRAELQHLGEGNELPGD